MNLLAGIVIFALVGAFYVFAIDIARLLRDEDDR